jgi:hypothetical protein
VKKLFALLLASGLMALGCGPAPSTQKSTPPATTAPGAGTEKKGKAPDEQKGAEKKGGEKGGE